MTDKQKHFAVGALIGASAFVLSFWVAFDVAVLMTFALGSVVFVGKEIFDKYKPRPTGFDTVDLFVDYLGWLFGTMGAVILFLIVNYLK